VVKASINGVMEAIMMGNFLKEKWMVMVNLVGRVVSPILEHTKMIKKKDKVSLFGRMDLVMKVLGKMENKMEKGNIQVVKVKLLKVFGMKV